MAKKTDSGEQQKDPADASTVSGEPGSKTTKAGKKKAGKKKAGKKKAGKKKAGKKKAGKKKAGKKGRPPGAWSRTINPERITKYLERSGVSKRDFADRVGVSAATVSNWTNEKSTPTDDVQYRIAEAIKEGPTPVATVLLAKPATSHARTLEQGEIMTGVVAAECNRLAREILTLAGNLPSPFAAKLSQAVAILLEVGSGKVS